MYIIFIKVLNYNSFYQDDRDQLGAVICSEAKYVTISLKKIIILFKCVSVQLI